MQNFDPERFNSKLVRLKVDTADRLFQSHRCFNSKLVRLKGVSIPAGDEVYLSFNSKLVRLKVCEFEQ